MKLYKINFENGTDDYVEADTYSKIDREFVFFRAGSSVPDVFFKADGVVSVNVACNDLDAALGQKTGDSY
ncbi:MAG: hypothetical protein ABJB32_00580 [Verrucomicrobiota bacterium]